MFLSLTRRHSKRSKKLTRNDDVAYDTRGCILNTSIDLRQISPSDDINSEINELPLSGAIIIQRGAEPAVPRESDASSACLCRLRLAAYLYALFSTDALSPDFSDLSVVTCVFSTCVGALKILPLACATMDASLRWLQNP